MPVTIYGLYLTRAANYDSICSAKKKKNPLFLPNSPVVERILLGYGVRGGVAAAYAGGPGQLR